MIGYCPAKQLKVGIKDNVMINQGQNEKCRTFQLLEYFNKTNNPDDKTGYGQQFL